MSSVGGTSSHLFDTSDSQADMSWLESQPDQGGMPTNGTVQTSTNLSKDTGQTEIMEMNATTSEPARSVELNPSAVELRSSTKSQMQPSIPTDEGVKVKKEPLDQDFGLGHRVDIDLTKYESFDNWKTMPSHIVISDSEDEPNTANSNGDRENSNAAANLQAHQQSEEDQLQDVNGKGKGPESTQANNGDENFVPTSSGINFGNSLLRTPNSRARRTAIDPVKARELQAAFRARALARDRDLTASLSGGISSTLGPTPSDPVRIVEEDALPSGSNNADGSQTDSLFLPQGSSKRTHAATVESDSDFQEIDGSTVPDTRGKPKRKRQAKARPLTKKQWEKVRAEEWQASLGVGFEGTSSRRGSKKGRSANNKGKGKQSSGGKVARPGGKRVAKKVNKNQELESLVAGLRSHDVLAEANANLDRAALPTVDERDKQKYLAALLASVSTEDRPGVKGDRKRVLDAAKNFGHGAVTLLKEGRCYLKGMQSTLHPHQLLGASQMRDRELGSEQPHGGILADEMGFGKTIMMIATMLTNPAKPSDKAKSTLIVCPPSLLLQWKREILAHVESGKLEKVLNYYGSSTMEGSALESVLEELDVVLTTYPAVRESYPLKKPPAHLETTEEQEEWWEKHWTVNRGLLHRAQFHRVVLDESQAIRNHKTHTSKACQALMARHKWAISGTPILNGTEELYPYFKFLRVPFSASYEVFRENFCGKGDPIYMDRLHACLSQFMIRRTHQDRIFAAPIVKLPKSHAKTEVLRPTKAEMYIYKAIEERYIRAVNAVSKKGTEEQIKRVVMALLTNLRQMTAHIFLIQHIMQDSFELSDIKNLQSRVGETDMALTIEELISHKHLYEKSNDESSQDSETVLPNLRPQPSTALVEKFQKHLQSLIANSVASEFSKRTTCPRCGQPPEDPYVTSCMHVYCHDCLIKIAHEAAEKAENGARCLECETHYTNSTPCEGVKELGHEILNGLDQDKPQIKKIQHEHPKDRLKWIRRDEGTLPSTKSKAVVDQIEQWLTEDPEQKIVVFSQWRMMMLIVGRDCDRQGVGYLAYHGGMHHKQRDQNLTDFKDDPDKKVLIASLKCGGVGLNLNMASRVLCIDLWFNFSIEQQAFCRIFRIGQESETHFNRLVLKGTVDERLLALQEAKKKVISRALGDTEAFKVYTAEDLMRLFGHVKRDEHDRPFIVEDDHESRTVEEEELPAEV